MSGDVKNLFGKRLKQARVRKKWSLKNLREEMGEMVSIAALSKYEKGQTMPSSKVLIALSRALDVSVDFLFRSYEIELERIKFRKQTQLRKKDIDQIREYARDFFERYFQIEEIVGSRISFKENLKHEGKLDVDKLANTLRQHLDLGNDPISNVHSLLEDNGVKVWFSNHESNAFSGFSAETSQGPVAVISKRMTAARKRNTALHELAHILVEPMHLGEKEEEVFVTKLPAALLLPKEIILAALGESRNKLTVGELWQLKQKFGISMSAIVMRAADLGIINESSKKSFFMFGPGKRWRSQKAEDGDNILDESFPEKSFRFKQLVYRAYGEELITISQAAHFLEQSIDQTKLDLNPF